MVSYLQSFPATACIFLLHLTVWCVFTVFWFYVLHFFCLKATFFFCKGFGNLLGALFHSETSMEETIKLQWNHLEKKMFSVDGRSFLLKNSLTDLHLLCFFSSWVLFSDLRTEVTIACRARSRQSVNLPFLTSFLHFFFLCTGPHQDSQPQHFSYPVLSRLPSRSCLSWAERFFCAKGWVAAAAFSWAGLRGGAVPLWTQSCHVQAVLLPCEGYTRTTEAFGVQWWS